MELVKYNIPWKLSNKPFYLAFLGDFQWNGRNGPTAKEHLKRHMERCLELDAWYIGMGDYIDFMSPSNRQRMRSAALYDTAEDSIDEKAMDLTQEVFDQYLRPTKGRWIGLLEGHHFTQLKSGDTTDQRLAAMLGTRFLGTSAYVNLLFRVNTAKLPVVLWVHHGCGGGMTDGAPLAKLDRIAARFEGADVFAMGHTCLAARARILTRRGFKSYDDVIVGEDVLGYDVESKTNKWVPLLGKQLFLNEPLLQARSKSFRSEMTPDHQWVMRDHDGTERLKTLEDAKSYEQIVTCARSEEGVSDMTPREAAILGWLVTDGCLSWSKNNPGWAIVQKKQPYVDEIRQLLGDDGREHKHKHGQTQFYVRARLARRFAEDFGVRVKGDLPALIPKLTSAARQAMLKAFMDAEGDKEQRFNQAPGPVWDTFLMLTALEGIRCGVARRAYDHTKPMLIEGRRITPSGPVLRTSILRRRKGPPTVSHIAVVPIEPGAVWCPTTPLGTWVAELDGNVFITGNTKMPATRIAKPYPNWSSPGGPKLVHRDALLVNTGGFAKSYAEFSKQGQVPRGGYAEQGMMPPAAVGAPILEIRPHFVDQGDHSKGNRKRQWAPEIRVIV